MDAEGFLRVLTLGLLSTGIYCGTSENRRLNSLDLRADKQVTICSRGKSPLTCESPGSAIAITGVFWGRQSPNICPSEDGDPVTNCPTAPETRNIVKEMCEGMGSCVLEGKADKLQKRKHCYGVQKYLLVNYTCVPQKKELVLCDSEKSILFCPSDWVLKVNSAFWGRQSSTLCPSVKGQEKCPGASETISKLRSKCSNIPFCPVKAFYKELQNGGENCPRVEKYLIVNYSCHPSPDVGRRGQLGLLPLSVYRSLRIRSKIWNPDDLRKRNAIIRRIIKKHKQTL
ncbi:Rhamnose-binding lectin [Acropora cervicornis]|uniref:Rhamnose-binding lectin n=1 Tax=Acropora cervicornis TaxID=6130 RepID=A0AAD9UTX2_ACRCE|nr:Rhamnose-binding lectin [Acropora cervicornis]